MQVARHRLLSRRARSPVLYAGCLKNAYLFTLLVYWLQRVFVAACGILAPRSGIKPGPPALGVQS